MYAVHRIPGSSRLFWLAILVVGACGRPADERVDSTADTARAPTARAAGPSAATFVSRGACPFECCVYGRWTLRTIAQLRPAPRVDGPARDLAPGAVVSADSGVVVVDPIGLLEVTAAAPMPRLGDSLRAQPGDTVELLDYIGEGIRRVRLRGRELEVEEFWRYTDARGVRMLREPVQHWWVFMTDSASRASGWVLMDSVRVAGADACG